MTTQASWAGTHPSRWPRPLGSSIPALVMYGTVSMPFMPRTARTLAGALPNAELRTLDGQDHNVDAAALAPVLTAFLSA